MSNDLEKAIDNLSKALDKLYKVLPIVEDESLPKEHQSYACGDCISRQVVKDMLTAEWTKYMPMELDMNLSFVLDKISVLPSVIPKTKWIPVSERLPEDVGGEYLVNIEYKGKHEGIDIAEYQIGGYMDGLWITPNDWIEGPSELWHVTAWMPLPEPYKSESEETKCVK